MSETAFESFGKVAGLGVEPVLISGRYEFQAEEEKNISRCVAERLQLQTQDRLLEIGCGCGNVLIPLSSLVSQATGIDHANCIEVLSKRLTDSSIRTLPGNFLKLAVNERFSKILVYSVLHYLSDEAEVIRFVEKALALLEPGGLCLLGDIPNVDRKRRFAATAKGKEIAREWEQQVASTQAAMGTVSEILGKDRQVVTFDDAKLARLFTHFRGKGFEVDILSQPNGLPFCYTREDMLIRAPLA